MKENVLDVLMFLFENYLYDEPCLKLGSMPYVKIIKYLNLKVVLK